MYIPGRTDSRYVQRGSNQSMSKQKIHPTKRDKEEIFWVLYLATYGNDGKFSSLPKEAVIAFLEDNLIILERVQSQCMLGYLSAVVGWCSDVASTTSRTSLNSPARDYKSWVENDPLLNEFEITKLRFLNRRGDHYATWTERNKILFSCNGEKEKFLSTSFYDYLLRRALLDN